MSVTTTTTKSGDQNVKIVTVRISVLKGAVHDAGSTHSLGVLFESACNGAHVRCRPHLRPAGTRRAAPCTRFDIASVFSAIGAHAHMLGT